MNTPTGYTKKRNKVIAVFTLEGDLGPAAVVRLCTDRRYGYVIHHQDFLEATGSSEGKGNEQEAWNAYFELITHYVEQERAKLRDKIY